MAVVVRPRLVVVVLVLVGTFLVGVALVADDEEAWGRTAMVAIVVVLLASVVRHRVEVWPDRVRVVRTFRSEEVLRQRVVAVHAAGGRGRPAYVAVDGGPVGIAVPSLIDTGRIAAALGVPHRTWRGAPHVSRRGRAEVDTPWVVVLAVLLAATAVAIPIWCYATA
jgi:hypothetical protein